MNPVKCIRNLKTVALLISIFLFLLGGCVSYKEFQLNISLESSGKEKLPLRAGLYLSPNFKQFSYVLYNVEFHTDVYGKFGEALSKCSESVVAKAFRDYVILTEKGINNSKGIDVLIEPEIDGIDTNYGRSTATLRIKWSITDINGRILYKNTFVGEGDGKEKGFGYPAKLVNACTLAIEDNCKKALAGITGSRWWEGVGLVIFNHGTLDY